MQVSAAVPRRTQVQEQLSKLRQIRHDSDEKLLLVLQSHNYDVESAANALLDKNVCPPRPGRMHQASYRISCDANCICACMSLGRTLQRCHNNRLLTAPTHRSPHPCRLSARL